MRGEHDAKYSYKYFSVCRYCWAIPYDVVSEKKGAQFSRKGQPSRHAADCEKRAFESLAGSDLLEVALGHEFESDSIRFYAEDSEFMPSLRALLQLALKIRLGGQPSHIATTATLLHERDSGIRNIITLYDRVPGGSGHLTSLMPKVSEAGELRSTSGLRQLRGLLQKTLDHIHACDCENGCYHCLLSKANEFDHKDIVKDRAIGWLDRFLQVEESEWVCIVTVLGR
jgi:DEAD/DEAH box helicase domain-containing protein